ncbi:NTP transferase domain-containing protein [Streptomyces sp. MP131-18]|uniref:NTP transferase domain-containing protein n=1 Tax=Streptomyces sp. MP131-18 TaxID=1857892 RepID=UPI00097C760B|nr:NTP transferase domain-containing protein [Streptomyces sp. MP131-18]ONK12884.1 molybdopterin-guanine dinucleotide biosynthesis protein MobA [Streptomyces sp. MP131-18]
MASYDAVVLAGGAARRLGGADKPAVRVGARSLLDRVLAACPDAAATVVVGPRRAVARPVRWAREDPPGGGPLAALHAGLAHTDRPLVAVLAADLPFLTADTVHRLLAVPDAADGVLLHDAEGQDQPLTAVYRTEPLRREIAVLAAEFGTLAGLPLKLALSGLAVHRLPAPDGLDCDTWADIATARARIRDDGAVLDEWIAAVKTELGIDPDVDTTALLDAARDAAHGVARPAAPLTTFLIGYAAALHGMSPAEAARKVSALAESWQQEEPRG